MKKIKQIVTCIAFVLCMGALTPIYAGDGGQGNGNGNGNGNGSQGNGNGNGGNSQGGATVPINTGLVFLLAAGVVIGGYVLYKKNTKGATKANNA
jgi:hypothetical protein